MKNQNETKQITAQLVKSNASENLVWEVSITGSRSKKHYCKTARKALSLLFIIKKEKNIPIAFETLRYLKAVIAKQKTATAAATQVSMEAQS